LAPLPKNFSSLKQTIANNILKGIVTYFFQLAATFLIQKQLEIRRIENLNVPSINNTKYFSLYLKVITQFFY
jgi:hypothetical protein